MKKKIGKKQVLLTLTLEEILPVAICLPPAIRLLWQLDLNIRMLEAKVFLLAFLVIAHDPRPRFKFHTRVSISLGTLVGKSARNFKYLN